MNTDLYNNLLDLFKKKQFPEIEKKYYSYFSKSCEDKKILNFFAIYFIKIANYSEANKCLEKAEQNNENDLNTIINFANLYISTKKIKKATVYLEKAIKLDKKNIYALNLLANIFLKQKKTKSSKKLFIKLARLETNNFEYLLNLADLLFQEGKYKFSIIFYTKLLKKNNTNPRIYMGLSNCFFKLDNLNQAINYLNEAIKLFPKITAFYLRKNEILRSYGNFDEALDAIKIGLIANQKDPQLIFAKSKLVSYEKFSNEINNYELLFVSLPKSIEKSILGFALYKIFNDLHEYSKASRYLDEANKIKFELTNYSMELENQQFLFLKKNITNKYVSEFIIDKKKDSCNQPGPIFIVGMQRSGSTLLEQMLARHSKTKAFGEVDFYPLLFQKYFDDYDLELFKKSLLRFTKQEASKLGEAYLKKVNFSKNSISIDKLLSNFKLIGPILMTLQNAKIVHIYRNPADVCFSIYSNFFNSQTMPWSSDQKSIINYYKQYELLMKHWNNLFPNKIFNVSYEKLIEEPNIYLKSILNFCNLEWEDECLKFYKNKNKVETESFLQVRKKIYKSSGNKYLPYRNYYKDFFSTLTIKSIF